MRQNWNLDAADVKGIKLEFEPSIANKKIFDNISGLHKVWHSDTSFDVYGLVGFDKDEREMFKRLWGITLKYKTKRNIKLIDVVPDFEKKWAFLSMPTSYGDDGWNVEYERRKKKAVDVRTMNIAVGSL